MAWQTPPPGSLGWTRNIEWVRMSSVWLLVHQLCRVPDDHYQRSSREEERLSDEGGEPDGPAAARATFDAEACNADWAIR